MSKNREFGHFNIIICLPRTGFPSFHPQTTFLDIIHTAKLLTETAFRQAGKRKRMLPDESGIAR